MRKRIYEVIEFGKSESVIAKIYDISMMIIIIISLVPIALKESGGVMDIIEGITTIIFIVDYILRLATADYKLNKGAKSFFIYPFTPMAIIDLLSILPSLVELTGALRILRVLRLLRTFRVFRAFKFLRYSKSITIILNVIKKQKDSLIVVGGLAVGYIVISALLIISIEPDTFPTFFDALYWATISLTTVGYGDIYATSDVGKIITMLSSILGIAIVALPAGIITAGYIDELNKDKENLENEIDLKEKEK